MTKDALSLEIDIHKVHALLNRRTPVWALLMLVGAFSYLYWEAMPNKVLYLWILPNAVIALVRLIWLHPFYQRTEINEQNTDFLLRLHTINVGISSLIWAFVLPFFFTPHDSELLLIFIFTFFILMTSGAIALASHMPAFFAYWLPLVLSLSWLFFSSQNTTYSNFALALLLFNIFTAYLFRRTNQEVTDLVRLQLEKQKLADDLEEKKQIAEKSVSDKNQFLASASHDLRQPLHSAGLLLSALDTHVETEKGKQLLEGISSSFKMLNDSFRSLLDVSKLDAGVIEVNKEHFCFKQLVDDVHKQFDQELLDKKLTFKTSQEDMAVYSDFILLNRIVRNLLANAISYTEHGVIRINWHAINDNKMQISIRDTGIGIPKEELDNIFSEYYQLHNPERDRSKGFGLGLAIVKRLCDLLEITLRVKSQTGQGTEFILTIDRGDSTKIISKRTDSQADHDLRDKRVLVIDDDAGVLNSMYEILSLWGCTVYCSESEDTAVELMTKLGLPPHIIIADYRLRNHQTGVQACERIADEFNLDIPSIIATGDTSQDRLKEASASGYQILHKPVEPEELRSAIFTALDTSLAK